MDWQKNKRNWSNGYSGFAFVHIFQVCFCSRSRSKVSSFLCYLQCTLQILIKEFTPVTRGQNISHQGCSSMTWLTHVRDRGQIFDMWQLPDRHLQRVEGVLEGEVWIDLVNLPQECINARLPGVCQHNELYTWKISWHWGIFHFSNQVHCM